MIDNKEETTKMNENEQEITKITILDDEIDQKPSENCDLIKKENAELKEKVNQVSDAFRRITTEFDNYKRRTNETNKTVLFEGKKEVLEKLLLIADSLISAKNLIKDESVLKGLSLIDDQLNAIFNTYNVKKIDCIDEQFNPDFHNAVLSVDNKEKSGLVVEIVKNGYTIEDKILRYAYVVVAK